MIDDDFIPEDDGDFIQTTEFEELCQYCMQPLQKIQLLTSIVKECTNPNCEDTFYAELHKETKCL